MYRESEYCTPTAIHLIVEYFVGVGFGQSAEFVDRDDACGAVMAPTDSEAEKACFPSCGWS